MLTYPAAALLGFGFSAMFVNALSFATDLIGDNKVSLQICVIMHFICISCDFSSHIASNTTQSRGLFSFLF